MFNANTNVYQTNFSCSSLHRFVHKHIVYASISSPIFSPDHICRQQRSPFHSPEEFSKSVCRIVLEILPSDSPLSLCLLSEACLPAFFNIPPSSLSLSALVSCSLFSVCSLTSYLPSSWLGCPFPPYRFNMLLLT